MEDSITRRKLEYFLGRGWHQVCASEFSAVAGLVLLLEGGARGRISA